MTPPPEVLAAWGVVDDVVFLPGGGGTAYATDDLVLKPVGDRSEAEWLAATLEALPRSSAVRVIRPVPARHGGWVVAGWSAWERIAGTARPGRWRDALDVADRFHSLVADVPWSDAMARHHPWALGDAFAWGEQDLTIPAVLAGAIGDLIRRRAPIDLPDQFVHGDLSGNILYEDGLPPAVIDVSPYWRPRRYAGAILVVDSMAWHGAGEDALERFADPAGVQLLVRSLLFRLGTAAVAFGGHEGRLRRELLAHEPVLRALGR